MADQRIFASPLARRLAEKAGLDLKAIQGSGPRGRIVKVDILAAGGRVAPSPSPLAGLPAVQASPPAQPLPADAAFTAVPNTQMRKIIARRLAEAKASIPHFYLSVDCEMDALMKVRAELNARSDAYKLSLNDFIIRAVALGLKAVPAANASWSEDFVRRWTDIDVAVAVATESGLVTPIIRHADRKGLAEISAEIKALAARGRENRLRPEEYQGGGITISNLGMYGIREFAAIINPPQGAILAVGGAEPRPVVKNGALAVATMMSCTLSVDHRVIDGAVGAQFLAAFKGLIQDPLSMLL